MRECERLTVASCKLREAKEQIHKSEEEEHSQIDYSKPINIT